MMTKNVECVGRMRGIGSGVVLLVVFGTLASAVMGSFASAGLLDSPVGNWTTIDDDTGEPDSVVEIWEEKGLLRGKITKLVRKPNEDPNPLCVECEGERKGQPVIGMTILWDLARDGETWSNGSILDPGNGRVYRSTLKLTENGRVLEVRGYIGISLFGRTQRWLRLD